MVDRMLSWIQPHSLWHNYLLQSDGRTIATISWDMESESTATVCSGGKQWILKLTGILSPVVTALTAGQRAFAARFSPMLDGEGVLELEDGRRFYWLKSLSPRGEQWSLLDESHWPVLILRTNNPTGFSDIRANLSVDPAVTALPCFPLIAAICWYTVILHLEDSRNCKKSESAGIGSRSPGLPSNLSALTH